MERHAVIRPDCPTLRTLTALLLLIAILPLGACTQPESQPAAPTDAPVFPGDPWPAIRAERIATLLPAAMDQAGLDAWLTICRENDNDPMARHIGCENAGGSAAFMFFRTEGGVTSVAISPAGEATALAEKQIMDEVVQIGRGSSLWDQVQAQLERFDPGQIGVNTGSSPIADGLSHTQYAAMAGALSPDWMARVVSAEPMIHAWLAVKLPGSATAGRPSRTRR
jgi:Xaa-Pro dipeptidase